MKEKHTAMLPNHPKANIAIIDRGFVSPYWGNLFARLNRESRHQHTVFHGPPPRNTGLRAAEGPYNFPNVPVNNFEIPIFQGKLIYQPLFWQVFRKFDVIVISHEVKFISSMLLALAFRLTRRPVVLWGYGFHARRGFGVEIQDMPWVTKLLIRFKNFLLTISNAYLVYTPGGRSRLVQQGYPGNAIWTLRQTVDTEKETELHRSASALDKKAIRQELGLSQRTIVFLYIGRIIPVKRVEDLVELTAKLNCDSSVFRVESLIVGGGPQSNAISKQIKNRDDVSYLGEIYDEKIVAKILRVTDAVVLPGAAGITVTHAFAHGVPVLTRESEQHSPEAEYVVDNVNGLHVAGTFDDFVDEVSKFVNDHALRKRLTDGALASRAEYSLVNMVAQFDNCITKVVNDPSVIKLEKPGEAECD